MNLDPDVLRVAELLRLPRMLDVAGLAEFLGLSQSWVRKQVSSRAIPYNTCGSKQEVRFGPLEVAEILLAGHRRPEVTGGNWEPAPAASPATSTRRSRRRAA